MRVTYGLCKSYMFCSLIVFITSVVLQLWHFRTNLLLIILFPPGMDQFPVCFRHRQPQSSLVGFQVGAEVRRHNGICSCSSYPKWIIPLMNRLLTTVPNQLLSGMITQVVTMTKMAIVMGVLVVVATVLVAVAAVTVVELTGKTHVTGLLCIILGELCYRIVTCKNREACTKWLTIWTFHRYRWIPASIWVWLMTLWGYEYFLPKKWFLT